MRFRVLTYNVQAFRGGIDDAASIVAAEEPDVVMLQECGPKRSLRRFAHALGMEAESTHRRFGRIRNAALCRPPWRIFGVEIGSFSREGRTLPRGFVAVRLRRAGVPLIVVSAHLGLSSHERERHGRELTDWTGWVEDPLVMGVDLNEGPESPAARWLAGRLFDAFTHAGRGPGETFPARVPTVRIDYLFVSSEVRPIRAWVSTATGVATASDHRPLVADLDLPG